MIDRFSSKADEPTPGQPDKGAPKDDTRVAGAKSGPRETGGAPAPAAAPAAAPGAPGTGTGGPPDPAPVTAPEAAPGGARDAVPGDAVRGASPETAPAGPGRHDAPRNEAARHESPRAAEPVRDGRPAPASDGAPARFMDPSHAGRFQERWHEVQSGFVDDPSEAVRRADELAAEVVNALGQAITARKQALDEHLRGAKGGAPDTEQYRLALRGYRDLLDRMLSI